MCVKSVVVVFGLHLRLDHTSYQHSESVKLGLCRVPSCAGVSLTVAMALPRQSWSLRTVRDTQTQRGDLLWSLKGPLVHINVMEKRGESTARRRGKVNATTIRRIRPRGAEWLLRASADH